LPLSSTPILEITQAEEAEAAKVKPGAQGHSRAVRPQSLCLCANTELPHYAPHFFRTSGGERLCTRAGASGDRENRDQWKEAGGPPRTLQRPRSQGGLAVAGFEFGPRNKTVPTEMVTVIFLATHLILKATGSSVRLCRYSI
jgi:hypothetical protein